MNRDFKGVWIPKEIWLNKNLSAIDKVLLAEISSLDNEEHCFASNEYFSEFCGVSVATITRTIKKLKDLGFIECEMLKNDRGSYRQIKILNTSNQNDYTPYNQNDYTAPIKMITNYNNSNNIENDKLFSKENNATEESEFEFGKEIEPPKKKKRKTNLDELEDAKLLIKDYTNNCTLIQQLTILLNTKFEICSTERRHFYATTIKNYLDELSRTFGSDINQQIEAVKLSIRYNGTTKVMKPNIIKPRTVKDTIERIGTNDYDKYDRTVSEREF